MSLLSMAVTEEGPSRRSAFTGRRARILTNDRHSGARIVESAVSRRGRARSRQGVIVAGFRGSRTSARSRPSVAAAPTPRRSRSPALARRTTARSAPTSTACTRRTRVSSKRAQLLESISHDEDARARGAGAKVLPRRVGRVRAPQRPSRCTPARPTKTAAARGSTHAERERQVAAVTGQNALIALRVSGWRCRSSIAMQNPRDRGRSRDPPSNLEARIFAAGSRSRMSGLAEVRRKLDNVLGAQVEFGGRGQSRSSGTASLETPA